ncbi:MAG TPA: hypothetical protein VMW10_07745, partial [Alphaproteobacteria bacterium]|nr:hypothetical protein [Alphaproteobacteria bacterium]
FFLKGHTSYAIAARAALRLYQGKFMEACEGLSSYDKHGKVVLKALQSQIQNPDLPNEVLKLIGENYFSEIFKFKPKYREELKEDEEFRDLILKEAKEYKWFFTRAIEKGLLDSVLYNEIIDLCLSLEKTSSLSAKDAGTVKIE